MSMLNGDEIDAMEDDEKAAYYAANPLPDGCGKYAESEPVNTRIPKDLWEQ